MTRKAIGIDIGGTNTSFAFVDESGKIDSVGNIKTGDYSTIENFVEALSAGINKVLNDSDLSFELAGIGIGAPNGNFYEGTIEDAPNLPWNGVIPLADMMYEQFKVPSILTNDANAAAMGEMLYGAAREMNDFFEVTLGTGLGSGFVADGKLIYGYHGLGGELGHTIIEKDGRLCNCGRKGCFEQYASVTGFMKTAADLIEKNPKSSLATEISGKLSAEKVTNHAQKGDPTALKVFDITADKLAFGISNAVAITDPEAVILFGGLANAGDLLLRPAKKYLQKYLHSPYQGRTKLLLSALSNYNAAVLGASALVWNQINRP